MPQLELTVTEQIETPRAQSLTTQLRAHLEIDGPYMYVRKGADPSAIPQFIQIIGDLAPWLPLVYAAKVFLKSYLETLAQGAANATSALFTKDEVKPLAEVAAALADARKATTTPIEIVIGLDIPDRHFGTALHITANTAEEIAHALAVFVTRANDLSAIMKAEVEAGRAPLGRAIITLEKNGSLTVRWRDRKEFAEHEKHIP